MCRGVKVGRNETHRSPFYIICRTLHASCPPHVLGEVLVTEKSHLDVISDNPKASTAVRQIGIETLWFIGGSNYRIPNLELPIPEDLAILLY